MVFETKKIQLETLGEYLSQARKHLGFSLPEVSVRVGVKKLFLEALENGEFKSLPAEVYVFGFLRQLAELYHTDSKSLIDQYKKELIIQRQLKIKEQNEQGWLKNHLAKVSITPKLISLLAGALFLFFTVVYVIWQVSSINRVPSLQVFQPTDRQLIFGSSVDVKGKTDPGMNVTVNDQDVFVDSSGGFQIELSLEAGPKDLVVVAKNKFDKIQTVKVSVVGQPQVAAAAKQVQLKLDFSGDGTLNYSIDDGLPTEMPFHSGDAKVLFGQNKILISTTNAGVTAVTFNGQSMGFMGRVEENLANIPFFAKVYNASSTGQ